MAIRTRALHVRNRTAINVLRACVILSIIISIIGWVFVTVGFQVRNSSELASGICFQRLSVFPIGVVGSILGFVNDAWFDFVIFIVTMVECLKFLRTKRTKLVWRIFCDSAGYYVVLTISM